MKMAELAERAHLSVPTVKFYIREGLLSPGERTGVNQADYGEAHVERLRLIRALATVASLPLAQIRRVIEAVDSQSDVLSAMAITQSALVGEIDEFAVEPVAQEHLDAVIDLRGWRTEKTSPAYRAALRAMSAIRTEGLSPSLERLDDYAQAADAIGRADLRSLEDATGLEHVLSGVVLGSILRSALVDALVLLAQQNYAIRQHDE